MPQLKTVKTIPSDRELELKNKYHCNTDLLFILFGFSCLVMLNKQQYYLFGQIQTSQTGGQPYSDTSPYGESSVPTM